MEPETQDEIERTLSPEPQGRKQRILALNYSHDAMVDTMIANPSINQNGLAAMFDKTPAWVSVILASDAFKMRLAARREQLIDPAILSSIEERFRALAEKSLEVLQEKLCQPQVSDDLALKAAALGAKALGIGGNASPKLVVNSSERLDILAGRLTGLLATKRNEGAIDVEAREVK